MKIWSAATVCQAIHRTDRKGQLKDIQIFYYLLNGSIDIYIYLSFLIHYNINNLLFNSYLINLIPQKFINSFGNLNYIKCMDFNIHSVLVKKKNSLYTLKKATLLPVKLEVTKINNIFQNDDFDNLLQYNDRFNLIDDSVINEQQIIEEIRKKYKILIQIYHVNQESISIFLKTLLVRYKDRTNIILFVSNIASSSSIPEDVGRFLISFSPPLSSLCYMNVNILTLLRNNQDISKINYIKLLYNEQFFDRHYNSKKNDSVNDELLNNNYNNFINHQSILKDLVVVNKSSGESIQKISSNSYRIKVIREITKFLSREINNHSENIENTELILYNRKINLDSNADDEDDCKDHRKKIIQKKPSKKHQNKKWFSSYLKFIDELRSDILFGDQSMVDFIPKINNFDIFKSGNESGLLKFEDKIVKIFPPFNNQVLLYNELRSKQLKISEIIMPLSMAYSYNYTIIIFKYINGPTINNIKKNNKLNKPLLEKIIDSINSIENILKINGFFLRDLHLKNIIVDENYNDKIINNESFLRLIDGGCISKIKPKISSTFFLESVLIDMLEYEFDKRKIIKPKNICVCGSRDVFINDIINNDQKKLTWAQMIKIHPLGCKKCVGQIQQNPHYFFGENLVRIEVIKVRSNDTKIYHFA
jgi:hypothetical protein